MKIEYGKTYAEASTRKLNIHIRACLMEAVDEGLIRIDFTRGAVLTGLTFKGKERNIPINERTVHTIKMME